MRDITARRMVESSIDCDPFQIVDPIDDTIESVGLGIEPSFSCRDEDVKTPKQNEQKLNDMNPISKISGLPNIEDNKTVESHREDTSQSEFNYDDTLQSNISIEMERVNNRGIHLIVQNEDTEIQKLAKRILGGLNTKDVAVAFSLEFKEPKDFIVSQEVIDSHISVLHEMMNLVPIDTNPCDIVLYISKTLEMPEVSSISGPKFLAMKYTDQVNVILAIARLWMNEYWQEYDGPIYAEYHRKVDLQTKIYVKTKYHSDSFCCVIS